MQEGSAVMRLLKRAHAEYAAHCKQLLEAPSLVERHFLEAIKEVKKLEKKQKPRKTQNTQNKNS
jgi:hypothetical protein